MKTRWWWISALLLTVHLAGAPLWAQTPASPAAADRLRAVAQRVGLPDDALAPVLACLARLEADRLPTVRFMDRMVECIAKRASPETVRNRAEKLERDTREAQAILARSSPQGLPPASTSTGGTDPVEELADALQSSPVTYQDLLQVSGFLKADTLARVLAGTDAMAHLRRMGLDEGLIRKLLAASKPSLPDFELRAFPSALFTGRRCGKEDADIVSAILRRLASGGKPSELAREWSESPSFRGGMPRNPNWSPGSGEGQGPRGGRGNNGQGSQGGQGQGQGGPGRGGGRRGGR